MANEQSKGAKTARGKRAQEPERSALPIETVQAEPVKNAEVQGPKPPRQAPGGERPEPQDNGAGSAERRNAASARRQIAANDDLPSIGGLIYALQQRPSRSTFLVALVSSLVWLVLTTTVGWALLSEQISGVSGFSSVIENPSVLALLATIVIPITLFWFLALLIWRAQELRLMASAMTEVAVRLAEPDQMAEQSVASVGQTIRRQVAAMNDAISRALGRAGELEALVHNELAVLERSYGENELRIRGLIDELASEREALANNSERVSQALTGIGNRVARDITMAGEQATKALASATTTLADTLAAKGDKITAAVSAAGTAVDTRLAERGAQVTEQLVGQGRAVAEKLDKATRQVALMLQETTKHVTASIEANRDNLFQSLSNVSERIESEVPLLLERLDKEQSQLSHAINEASHSISALETAVAKGTGNLNTTLHQHSNAIQTVFTQKTQQLDSLLMERTRAIDSALGQRSENFATSIAERINALDTAFTQQSGYLETKITEHTENLGGILNEGMEAVRQSAELMNAQSGSATQDMAAQAENLREVSRGLLDQIHSLTQRFENQGQAIMSAAQALDSSNAKIDSILERRHGEISGLLVTVGTKAQDLDKMMHSYSDLIENSLVKTEARARQLGESLTHQTTSHSQSALTEIEQLRAEARGQTEKAVLELKANFEHITGIVNQQLTHLTTQFGRTTQDMKDQAQRTVGELESTREALHRRMRDLPRETKESAEAVRQVLSEQIRALGTLTALASEHGGADDISRPAGGVRLIGRDSNGGLEPPRPALTAEPRPTPAIASPPTAEPRPAPVITPPPAAPVRPTALAVPPAASPTAPGNDGRFSYVNAAHPPEPGSRRPSQVDFARPVPAHRADEMRNPALPPPGAPVEMAPAPTTNAPTSHRTDPEGHLASVTANLAQRLTGAGTRDQHVTSGPASALPPERPVIQAPAPDAGRGSWSLGDLLARASEHEDGQLGVNADLGPAPQFLQSSDRSPAAGSPIMPETPPVGSGPSTVDASAALRLDDLANAIDHHTAVEVWQRFRQGDRSVLSKQLYSHQGQAAFDEISERYRHNAEFRGTVDRYISDFERLLKEAESKDPNGALLQNYLSSETGRVYLMLAHASGRLR